MHEIHNDQSPRKAKVFPEPECEDIRDFREKLAYFDAEDYLETFRVYAFLLAASRSKVVYYDQFSEVLKEGAAHKGVNVDYVNAVILYRKTRHLLPADYGIPSLN